MLLDSEAYHACIGYFADNLDLFEGVNGSEEGVLIADIVSDQIADMLLTFFQQQPQLEPAVRLTVMAEGDKLLEDIEQILGMFWNKSATPSQREFIEEYFLLLKNSLDSQVAEHA
ncbi:DUF3802 domain-containing protein [Psychromonas sp. psych-6C06]|uniref:DUF3802 family protein n=1 Tax=Psychromonas sp. psych-6C06 TaxID=2058089 RepID=UPI000C31C169|nr:DUF3802 family protein [Psychromonas sp. psych-6C06]PKF61766.1 DUF3802 domain-containing protein [Psychromonas sp. psych-6C06]